MDLVDHVRLGEVAFRNAEDFKDGYFGCEVDGELCVLVPLGKLVFEVPADKHRFLKQIARKRKLTLSYLRG